MFLLKYIYENFVKSISRSSRQEVFCCRYTNADLKICDNLCLGMKIICLRFHIKTCFTLFETYACEMSEKFVYKHSKYFKNKRQARGCNQPVDLTSELFLHISVANFLHNDFIAVEMTIFTLCDYIYI